MSPYRWYIICKSATIHSVRQAYQVIVVVRPVLLQITTFLLLRWLIPSCALIHWLLHG